MRTLAGALAGLLMAIRAALAQPAPVEHLQVGPLDRTYVLERFHTDRAQGRLPIVIFLHGLGTLVTEPLPPRFDTNFAALSEMEPALIVHPQGVDRRWDSIPASIQTWQRLSGTNGEPVDDIGFLRTLIDHLVAEENGDAQRVYVAGVSAGGYLAARVACEMGDKVAAVADVIATARQAVFRSCNPRPVSFALIASTTDETNPYQGLAGGELTRLASAPDLAFFFARHDRCTTRTETAFPHSDLEQPSTVSLMRFSDCADGAEVLFYRVDGSGHSVPSLAPIGPESWAETGRRNRDMETAHELWAFFGRHRLATPSQ